MTQDTKDDTVSVGQQNSFSTFSGIFQDFAPPLLALPDNLKNLGVNSSRIGETMLPKADPLLSEYEKKYAQIVYTRRFARFVQENPSAVAAIKNTEMQKVLAKYLPDKFQIPFDLKPPLSSYDLLFGLFP